MDDDALSDGVEWFPAEPAALPLGLLVSRAGRAVDRLQRRVTSAHGLGLTGLGVLLVLDEGEAESQRDLAGRLGVSPATLTPVLDTLERAGELVRERDRYDRRLVRVSITDRGRERLDPALEQVSTAVQDGLPQPPPDQQQVIRGYLLAVLAAADDERLG